MSIEDVMLEIEIIQNHLNLARGILRALAKPDAPSNRLLFGSPVTGRVETGSNIYGGAWFSSIGYAALYENSTAYHTGIDLNLPEYADSGKTVYAAADGEIVFAGEVQGWQGHVVIIRHSLETGGTVWTRYAHIAADVIAGISISRGDKIGIIADYNRDGPRGDHLHFDVALIDLGARPGDWPGLDIVRLRRNYIDPVMYLKQRST
jgi:murein DD-endopeptidase MepM/ murein hydrolase activator NlpD